MSVRIVAGRGRGGGGVFASFCRVRARRIVRECHKAGPLDEETRRLVKLASAIGAGLEGGTHSAVRSALAAGVTPEEIRHAALLGVTKIGFPATMRGLTWIGDNLAQQDDAAES